ncbi:TadE/TadG family type IV pilus assembly protein [Croceibacterium sp. TMG7-5b_MA50]|uniref:TadE/TadG family type IV pilus assembly protein n=1 Tax=Croceibacterium sp. TMG7-5b_MA50 TaxID=3121290 RepID=UPI003221C22B
MIARRRLSHLLRAREGVAAAEFAMLAPAMFLLLMGTVEAAHFLMVQTTLEGAVSRAARENAVALTMGDDERDTAMRARIADIMGTFKVADGQRLEIDTRVYGNFASARTEPFDDADGNGQYDEGEFFQDGNGNGIRDVEVRKAGKMGEVGDVVAYSVTYPVDPVFAFLTPVFGGPLRMTSSTVVRNEPEKSVL